MTLTHKSWCPYCKRVTVHYGKYCAECNPQWIMADNKTEVDNDT